MTENQFVLQYAGPAWMKIDHRLGAKVQSPFFFVKQFLIAQVLAPEAVGNLPL
ncbi:MAG: hypothetical protein ONB48_20440 [candidate division KSB1 bacterium]|nr:hypothetical protein [candidate division KSB1 bacterium]MDZ7273356.1 hypothetical protein [candidate division KSB1 bacterium]MDZ7288018.1 hypothetical protein [candidate division KSB1 bacterium]MDZ7300130.1 hypothetical protein [candidate division KSB1 bacterium]MDZ7309372.1 hypothetical protein [candidate division KSB1 bacterium]